jgi:hypothetical protein
MVQTGKHLNEDVVVEEYATTLQNLPKDILQKIFERVNFRNTHSLAIVNQETNKIIDEIKKTWKPGFELDNAFYEMFKQFNTNHMTFSIELTNKISIENIIGLFIQPTLHIIHKSMGNPHRGEVYEWSDNNSHKCFAHLGNPKRIHTFSRALIHYLAGYNLSLFENNENKGNSILTLDTCVRKANKEFDGYEEDDPEFGNLDIYQHYCKLYNYEPEVKDVENHTNISVWNDHHFKIHEIPNIKEWCEEKGYQMFIHNDVIHDGGDYSRDVWNQEARDRAIEEFKEVMNSNKLKAFTLFHKVFLQSTIQEPSQGGKAKSLKMKRTDEKVQTKYGMRNVYVALSDKAFATGIIPKSAKRYLKINGKWVTFKNKNADIYK